jgi:hypothetical protein
MTAEHSTGTPGPRWRALLEARWQAYVQEVTELSLAYHVAAAAVPDGTGDGAGQPEVAALLRRAVGARRKLADIEDALGRLAAGRFARLPRPGTARAATRRLEPLKRLECLECLECLESLESCRPLKPGRTG